MKAVFEYKGPAKSKKPLVISDRQALWLMRMVVGEGGRRASDDKIAALLWAIVHRWFLWKGSRFYPTFVSMLRAFSQPINPRWMTGGDLARKYAGRDAASKRRLARRARICSLELGEIPIRIRKNVNAFVEGRLFFPDCLSTLKNPLISNWASLKSTPKKFPWGVDIDGDWFFEDQNLKRGCVTVAPPLE